MQNPRHIILICFAYGLPEPLCAQASSEKDWEMAEAKNGNGRTRHAEEMTHMAAGHMVPNQPRSEQRSFSVGEKPDDSTQVWAF